MWTLIRNLGSSIGVSIVIANLTNKTIMMHARLSESLTPFNQAMADPAAAMLDPDARTRGARCWRTSSPSRRRSSPTPTTSS